ncbi:MAG: hypothetical protein ACR2NW_03500 [Thermodesulfobacteriota bacterium]
MSEYKILEKSMESNCEAEVLKILIYMKHHVNKTVSLHNISGFVGMNPTTLKEKYLDTLCNEGVLQKYYLRDETATYSINQSKLDDNLKILKSILNS